MDWSLYRCGREGHVTYAPDEQHLREHLRANTAIGELWQCLRCGSYVPGEPHGSGPVADAPIIRRGKQIRSDIILRLFAIERFGRFLLFAAFAYGIWRFAHSRLTITEAFNKELPILRSAARQLGINVDTSGVIGLVRRVLHISQSRLALIAVGVSAISVISLVEGIGLWLARRWGEYFALVATSAFLPFEAYELYHKFTITKIVLFLLNITLVVYLVLNRRLFGARGGKHAYEARLRSESVFDAAERAASVLAGTPDGQAAAAMPAAIASDPGASGPADYAPPAPSPTGSDPPLRPSGTVPPGPGNRGPEAGSAAMAQAAGATPPVPRRVAATQPTVRRGNTGDGTPGPAT